jgi:hypothetical protein
MLVVYNIYNVYQGLNNSYIFDETVLVFYLWLQCPST